MSQILAPADPCGCDCHDDVDGTCLYRVDMLDGGPLPLDVHVRCLPTGEALVVIDQVDDDRYVPPIEVPADVARQLIGLLDAGANTADLHAYHVAAEASA